MREHIIKISKIDETEQTIKGVVYKPFEVDTQGDWMEPEEIKKMAHSFMESMNLHEIDTSHNMIDVDAFVCESFIAKASDPEGYLEGSWVVAIKINDPVIWAGVLDGTYGGLSMFGSALAIDEPAPEN